MTTALAILLSAVVLSIAVLHAVLGPRRSIGRRPTRSASPRRRLARRTSLRCRAPGACFAVAAVLAGVAAWPLFAAGLLPEAWPRWLTLLAGAGMAAVFVGRGLAGYASAWRRRFSEEPFASLDRLAYSPLCLLLGAGYIALLI